MVQNIWVAAADNDLETVKKYIESDKFSANSKDPNGYTPIHAAVSYGHIDLLKYLISQNGDINIQDAEGDSPLHHVEDVSIAKLLVEDFKADWKLKNNEGQIPADYIEEDDEFPEVVQYLRSLSHENIGSSNTNENNDSGNILDSLPRPDQVEGHEISYKYQNEDIELTINDEQREKLREIAESENPEEKLAEFVKESVHNQFFNNDKDQDSPVSKKRRD
ncbi:Ankyrin [Wickerhamomyces ciferrii]|uniref:Ankyrin n=1 Tax=Wickerhamomyces ciferrii (strain ATCC 14091 / BCRC 22168 / CBS 111 / JCM 3599 / NBRC 0793 / NRRL Y-1031 F-60-10) TaxID=1206466 RepID=K0KN61_WICCF|nr:Ankyrin [Wickerhamomyces ciferrii]CCH42779.1 Ankyrin [Wickerhamomyces ciferrii]